MDEARVYEIASTVHVATGYAMIGVGCAGVVLNVFNLLIYCNRRLRSPINLLLATRAACDIGVNIFGALVMGMTALREQHTSIAFVNSWAICTRIFYPLSQVMQTASVWMTVTVGVHRFIAVNFPLHTKAICGDKEAKILISSVIGFACMYNAPRFFELHLTSNTTLSDANVTVTAYGIEPTQLLNPAKSLNTYRIYQYYYTWGYSFIMVIVPFILLTVMSAGIIIRIRQALKRRKKMSTSEHRDIKVSTMLITIVVAFLLFNLLPIIVNISELIDPEIRFKPILWWKLCVYIGSLCVIINSAQPFFIYIVFSRRFRQMFCHIITGGRVSADEKSKSVRTMLAMHHSAQSATHRATSPRNELTSPDDNTNKVLLQVPTSDTDTGSDTVSSLGCRIRKVPSSAVIALAALVPSHTDGGAKEAHISSDDVNNSAANENGNDTVLLRPGGEVISLLRTNTDRSNSANPGENDF